MRIISATTSTRVTAFPLYCGEACFIVLVNSQNNRSVVSIDASVKGNDEGVRLHNYVAIHKANLDAITSTLRIDVPQMFVLVFVFIDAVSILTSLFKGYTVSSQYPNDSDIQRLERNITCRENTIIIIGILNVILFI